MAKTVNTFSELKLLAAFADEDDRTLTITNPRDNLNKSDIDNVGNKAVNVLIGDKYGADFTRFKSAYYRNGTTITITF